MAVAMGSTSMTMFVVAGATLVVFALGFALYPLWRSRPWLGAGVGLALAAVTAALYLAIGTPAALNPRQVKAPQTLAEAVTQLEAELERDPNQIEGWRLLASAYTAEGLSEKARDAYARAVKLAPDNPDLLAEAAEARALAMPDRRFDAEAVSMLQHALQQQPMHQRARWFLGIAQRQAEQPAEAAKTWEPLLAVVDARTAASLLEQINGARLEAGLEPMQAPAQTPAQAARPAVAGPGLTVKVSLAPALAAKLPANASLFVLARQPNGAPMPVAVEKHAAKDFPIEVRLDDGDSPMPTMKLSQLAQVQVLARISASGNAIPQPGDLASAPAIARVADNGTVEIVIDRVVE
ncbi:TPR repeat family protein [Lysobacter antibioticus]|uniref:TPR repeat family protein n=2 Tax=Lysobacter antibioticus TaxID=84531 RepID=A0A0S2FAK4_LYSAN|nr:TPR repeat family protein [Lysobacter antibioticus]